MTPTPLDQIGLRWRDHKSALWWLGLLYRRPRQFQEAAASLSDTIGIKAGGVICSHALFYVLGLSILGRFFLWSWFDLPSSESSISAFGEIIQFHCIEATFGIFYGVCLIPVVLFFFTDSRSDAPRTIILLGIFGSIASGVGFGIFSKELLAKVELKLVENLTEALSSIRFLAHDLVDRKVASYIANKAALGVVWGLNNGVVFGISAGFFWGFILESLSDKIGWIAVMGVILFVGYGIGELSNMVTGVFSAMIISFFVFRVYYQLLFFWLSWPKPRGHLYYLHPAAWDDFCRVPFPQFDRLLVAYAEYAPQSGKREIGRLLNFSLQKKAVLRAQTTLIARQAAKEKDLSNLDNILRWLPEGTTGYVAQTAKLRGVVNEICQLQSKLNTITTPVLRRSEAQVLHQRIKIFCHEITTFLEPLSSEFRKAAINWMALAEQQLQLVEAICSKAPNLKVFRSGDPVNREQEAFVPRYGVVGDLEKQIMLATGCPGLVLYGRRRMGKSTILNNFNGFLPDTVIPVFVSMQDPQAFTSLVAWITNLMSKLLAEYPLNSQPIEEANLFGFMRVLSVYNTHLQETGKGMLLAIDEYENLDRKIGEKVFPEDLLATIRESIQTHRNITWIFAGSHEITELKHAEWPSYLVSARTIEVPMFTMAETRLLLTEPLKFSPLFKDESKRPRFEPGFWGENGIERIQEQAGGWPHLVQLIAETIVDVINDANQRQVDDTLFEAALNKAIVSGHNVLYQLLRGECTLPGEWEYLSAFRTKETQPLPGEEAIYVSLRRRLLMEEANGEWRLRVPLMARWLKQRG